MSVFCKDPKCHFRTDDELKMNKIKKMNEMAMINNDKEDRIWSDLTRVVTINHVGLQWVGKLYYTKSNMKASKSIVAGFKPRLPISLF